MDSQYSLVEEEVRLGLEHLALGHFGHVRVAHVVPLAGRRRGVALRAPLAAHTLIAVRTHGVLVLIAVDLGEELPAIVVGRNVGPHLHVRHVVATVHRAAVLHDAVQRVQQPVLLFVDGRQVAASVAAERRHVQHERERYVFAHFTRETAGHLNKHSPSACVTHRILTTQTMYYITWNRFKCNMRTAGGLDISNCLVALVFTLFPASPLFFVQFSQRTRLFPVISSQEVN